MDLMDFCLMDGQINGQTFYLLLEIIGRQIVCVYGICEDRQTDKWMEYLTEVSTPLTCL